MKRPSLNHCFRLIWSESHAAWMAVPEVCRGRGKAGRGLLAAVLLAPALALAAPSGGTVTSGSASITQSGPVTDVNQASQRAVINWQGFSVAGGETVNFHQPGRSAVTLNRVIGNERSVINGALNADGQVFLVNSNGVLFGQGSSVNVGGLVASTRDLGDDDFNAGRYVFRGSGTAAVVNQGALHARDGGYVALLGGSVSNQGVISATRGTVALAAGDRITLSFNGDSLLGLTLDQGTLDALVENRQAIQADGGQVILTALAADQVLGAQVNNGGLIRARTLDDLTGSITLYAHGGTTRVDGTLDASAPVSGNGGAIETSGKVVKVADGAQVTTLAHEGRSGTWLIDPTDFTIAASGGDISGATLSSQLAHGNVAISSTMGAGGTQGNVNVNDAVSWDAPTTLTLTAANDINVNRAVTAGYSAYSSAAPAAVAGLALDAGHDININNAVSLTNAALVMNYGNDYNIRTKASYSGTVLDANGLPIANTDTSGGVYGSISLHGGTGSGDSLTIKGDAYTLIYSMAQFDALDNTDSVTGNGSFDAVTGHYAIAHDLEAGGTTYAFAPVYFFSGTLAGLGNKIDHFTMDSPQYSVGLIGNGSDYGSVNIRDLGLVNISFTNVNTSNVGAFLGEGAGSITNVYSTGTISGPWTASTGGLVGRFYTGSATSNVIQSSFSSIDIISEGGGNIGGLAGWMSGSITNSHATGNITITFPRNNGTTQEIGGLAGNFGGTVSGTYATGNILAQYASDAIVVTEIQYLNFISSLGGLIGSYSGLGTDSLTNSFATGNVTGGSVLGGLIGSAYGSKGLRIDNVYATGNVTGTIKANTSYSDAYIGGLIGRVGQTSSYRGEEFSIDISNAFATGNVTALGGGNAVGGLIGYMRSYGRTGSLTNVYATGKVTVASVDGVYTDSAGGLVGVIHGYDVSNAYATGDVSANSHVGALIGTAIDSTVTNSYSTGAATAVDQTHYGAAGLIGYANNTSTSNTYFNADRNSRGIFDSWGNGSHDTTGLSGTQLPDSQYYANGTISQVIAARNEAAAEQRRLQESAMTNGANQAARSSANSARQNLTGNSPSVSPIAAVLDQNISFADTRYSAGIRSIEVDDDMTSQPEEENKTKR